MKLSLHFFLDELVIFDSHEQTYYSLYVTTIKKESKKLLNDYCMEKKFFLKKKKKKESYLYNLTISYCSSKCSNIFIFILLFFNFCSMLRFLSLFCQMIFYSFSLQKKKKKRLPGIFLKR